jgi:ribosome-associated protein
VEVKPGVEVPDEELEFSAARSGGPGGQNVNKVNSKVVLRWNLVESEAFSEHQKARLQARIPKRYLTSGGEVVVHASESRDQPKNKAACVEKLATVLRDALRRPKTRIPTKPSRASRQRKRAAKERHSRKKADRRSKDW